MGVPAAKHQAQNNETYLMKRFAGEIPYHVGTCDDVCLGCGATHWIKERPAGNRLDRGAKYSVCCRNGKVELPERYFTFPLAPPFLVELISSDTEAAKHFRENIRAYNNALSFTSLGAEIDHTVDGPYGIRCFKIRGEMRHIMGSLLPPSNEDPAFAQIYIMGPELEDEAAHRVKMSRVSLWPEIINQFLEFFYAENPYAIQFKMAHRVIAEHGNISLRLKSVPATIEGTQGHDIRTYARPSASEVAMIIGGGGDVGDGSRDIIVHSVDGRFNRISELHTGYLPLRYPVLFPYGQAGFDENYRVPTQNNDGPTVSTLQWFAYLLFQRRDQFSLILASQMLLQEFCTDLFACVENRRITWFRLNQATIKAELYSGAVEALGRNDFRIGRPVILPASHIGSPRAMTQLYHDAMALVRHFGPPTFFITMTSNDYWPEVQAALNNGEVAIDRPDIVARVFKMKLKEMMRDVNKKGRLGDGVSHVSTIEFQNRGRPHCHFIPIMGAGTIPRTPEAVDLVVRAEIPDPVKEPLLFQAVTKFMLHGPCREGSPCWKTDKCRFGYPKDFAEATTMTDDAYPLYRRRRDGFTFTKGSYVYTNRDVAPYNVFLLMKYNCHLNVEVACSLQAVKYLYKYITKGHDRAALSLVADNECDMYINGRSLTGTEACWKLFQYPMSTSFPAVQKLPLHLPRQQTLYFTSNESLRRRIESGKAERTPLTEFFNLSAENFQLIKSKIFVRTLTYAEMVEHFTWNTDNNRWKERSNDSQTIPRVYFSSISQGERYFMRLLLFHVPGPMSFEDLRTFEGVLYNSYHEAATARGLLLDDSHYIAAMKECSEVQSAYQLRAMFAIILKFGPPSDPLRIWNLFAIAMCDDCKRVLERANPDVEVSQEMIVALGLLKLSQALDEVNMTLSGASLPAPDLTVLASHGAVLGIEDEDVVSPDESGEMVLKSLETMNDEQLAIFEAVRSALKSDNGELLFLDGPGGTGKTFVLNAILHYCNGMYHEAVAVASSGIAALLLYKGSTAHTGLKIPIGADNESRCRLSGTDAVSQRLRKCRLIVWDEISMQNKFDIQCVDKSLRTLRDCDAHFGGIIVLFSGDFRQTLPVVPRANISQQAAASFKKSYLWADVKKYALVHNIRLLGVGAEGDEANETNRVFAEWLLRLGSGGLQEATEAMIELKHVEVKSINPNKVFDVGTAVSFYGKVEYLIANKKWAELAIYYAGRCIITPLNKSVWGVNDEMLDNMNGECFVSNSIDANDDATTCEPLTIETLNGFTVPNFPSHKIRLKTGMPIILLRNLNLKSGLCNGTRLIVTWVGRKILTCRIVNGPRRGNTVAIPRINLHHTGNGMCPLPFYRFQYPVAPAFCMTVNKSQGQSLDNVLILLPSPVFSHGQLYVALSRCTNAGNISVCLSQSGKSKGTVNIVYKEILERE